ncbi:hypothetical protein DFH28DRAFT_938759 [Melampsora americana]|nr:hypothetical protein DFH28DRAFT_938759 [Melampsora americana]
MSARRAKHSGKARMRRGQTQGGARITHAEKRYTRAKDDVGPKVAPKVAQGQSQVLRKPRTVTYSGEANATVKQIVHMGQGQADPKNRQGGMFTQGQGDRMGQGLTNVVKQYRVKRVV